MNHNDLASMISSKMASLVDSYRLRVIAIDESEALLVGSGYALQFLADREGLDVAYIDRDGGQLTAYTLRPLAMQRFTPADRAHFGSPVSATDRLMGSLGVYASGLANRCHDVMSGDRNWLKRDSWESGAPSYAVRSVLESEWLPR